MVGGGSEPLVAGRHLQPAAAEETSHCRAAGRYPHHQSGPVDGGPVPLATCARAPAWPARRARQTSVTSTTGRGRVRLLSAFLDVDAVSSPRTLCTLAISTWMKRRKSTRSRTVAILEPRRRRTTAMNSGNSSSSASSKMKSVRSTRPTASTPTSARASAAPGISTSASSSSFEIMPSPSASRPLVFSMPSRRSLAEMMDVRSFSAMETVRTVSHITPTSMFNTVKEAISAKRMKQTQHMKFSAPSSSSNTGVPSMKMP
mmetsp:Transcript_99344/g.256788  ORF Transcript_99344/g.256788 Transcript_99344/m.256788 type:complete len:259 (+) Transcript_99344:187-963(+)